MNISVEDMLAEMEAEAKSSSPGRNIAEISLEDLGFETPEEQEADAGFFKNSAGVLRDWYLGSHADPLDNLVGTAKGLAGGAVSLGRLGAAGIMGLSKSALQAWSSAGQNMRKPGSGSTKIDVAKNIIDSQEAVERFVEADKEFSKGILYINLAPKNKQEEAVHKFLGIIPEGIKAAGETAYEKTGNALFAAGTEAGLTLLTFKPSVATKALGGLKKALKGERQSSKAQASAKKAKAGFEELVKTQPEAAKAMAEHVKKVDPELSELLTEAVTEAKKKTPEQVGKEIAEADMVAVQPGMVRLYHGGVPGKGPRFYSVSKDKAQSYAEKSGDSGKVKYIDVPEAMLERDLANGIPGKSDLELPAELSDKAKFIKPTPLPPTYKVAEVDGKLTVQRSDGKTFGTFATKEQAKLRADVMNELAESNAAMRANAAVQAKAADGVSKSMEQGMEVLANVPIKPNEVLPEGLTREQSLKAVNEATIKKAKEFLERDNALEVQIKAARQKSTVSPTKANLDRLRQLEAERVKLSEAPPKETAQTGPNQVLFTDHGHPVTRAMVEEAFTLSAAVLDKIPGVRVVKGKLQEYYDQLIRTVNPEALGNEAKTGASILAKHIAIQMQKDSMYTHRAEKRRAYWNANLDKVPEFIKKFEKGEKFSDPVMQKAADGYKAWNEAMYKQDQEFGLKYDAETNYLAHMFEDAKGVVEYFETKYGPRWNSPKFVKERSFSAYDEAIAAGYRPKFKNPEDLMLARQHASDIVQMQTNALRELEAAGLAKKVEKGSTERPKEWPSTEWKAPTGEKFWVHNNASAVVHNAFNTKSLWSMPGIVGDAFRSAMFLKNTIVPIKLALSLFHPLHVATIHNATAMTRVSKELLSGSVGPAKWMKEMAKGAVYSDFISAPRQGWRLLKAYQGKLKDADVSPADRQSLQYMAEGGFIPEMAAQYKTSAIKQFKDAIHRRSLLAAWHLPFAAVMALQKPMFEIWIPSLKVASYLKDVQSALRADPALVNNSTKRQLLFRKLAKSVDNRYGEMAYNTLFWNRWVKDLGVANTLSLGWQLGFIREYGGGMLDLGQVVTKEGTVKQKAKSGMLDRPLFVTYYTAQALAYGGLMSWALSGKAPGELMDYLYPFNGEENPDGTPQRVTTMYYPREFSAIYKHMETEGVLGGLGHLAANKASGVVGMVTEWSTGVNSFGQEIRDPNAPLYKRLEQTIAHTLWELEPISVGAIREDTSENTLKSTILNVSGFSPAPKYVTETKTESLIKGTFRKYYTHTQTAFEKAQFSKERKELKKYFEDGNDDKYNELLDKMIETYELTGKEIKKLEGSLASEEDPILLMFSRLSWQQQKRILDQMTEEEREKFLPSSNKEHLRYSYEPPE
jgi:hypothetical protein